MVNEEKIACELCSSKSYEILYKSTIEGRYSNRGYKISDANYNKHPQVARCKNCGLVYTNPRDKKILTYYRKLSDREYQKEAEGRTIAFKRVFRNIEKYKKTRRLLDIGCATGLFLNVAKKFGWEVYGVEPSKWGVDFAKKEYGLDIFNGTLEEAKFQERFFDVISLLDVLEHVTHPKSLLKRVFSLLKKDGLLCIVTPNIESFIAKLLKEKWWHVRQAHLFYFSLKTLQNLLSQTGFKAVEIRSYKWTFNFHYWATRLEHFSPLLYKIYVFLKNLTFLDGFFRRNLGINFGDSLEVYALKR